VQCSAGLVCSNVGPTPGVCVLDSCYYTGCPGCDRSCHSGNCVDNPCEDDTCAADEVCKPSDDFTSHTCVASCADLADDCPTGQKCVDGACEDTCNPPCSSGLVCNPATLLCEADRCEGSGTGGAGGGAGGGGGAGTTGPVACVDGSCCDPLTGQCGDCPCEGIVCPDGQECLDDECWGAGGAGTGGTGGIGGGVVGGGGAGGTSSGGTGSVPQSDSPEVWRQSSGGGGCACELSARQRPGDSWRWLGLAALALTLGTRRRRKRDGSAAEEVSR
jgi:hypothetical protein